jgi:uncharacterized BrkB/YihY/UPF0761 family membrane protein
MDDPRANDEAPGRFDRAQEWTRSNAKRAGSWFADLRDEVTIVDVGARVFERDKDAGGTLLGSALALRLFLFFVPLLLVLVGVVGIFRGTADGSAAADGAGVSGTLANYVDDAFAQTGKAPWIALAVGLFGAATTGRSLTRALVLSSALSWRMGGKQRTPVRAIGVVTGLIVGLALSASITNRIQQAAGVAFASVSLIGLAAIYVVMWLFLFQSLPRKTTDPGAALPGAIVVALVLVGLQAITQFYLPHQIDSAAQMYGGIGVMVAFLGWFFFMGRVIAFSFALNAVIYEQVGSVSVLIFNLPVIRIIPQRVPRVAHYFAVDYVAEGEPEAPEPLQVPGVHRP